MTDNQRPLIGGIEFWAIKQETDDIAHSLGWSKDYCKKYIQAYYGCRSRLVMTDEQLLDLLATLRNLKPKPSTQKVVKRDRRNSRRRRI